MRTWNVQFMDGRDGGDVLSFLTPMGTLAKLTDDVREIASRSRVMWIELDARLPKGSLADWSLTVTDGSDSVVVTGRYVHGVTAQQLGVFEEDPALTRDEKREVSQMVRRTLDVLAREGFGVKEKPEMYALGSRWFLGK